MDNYPLKTKQRTQQCRPVHDFCRAANTYLQQRWSLAQISQCCDFLYVMSPTWTWYETKNWHWIFLLLLKAWPPADWLTLKLKYSLAQHPEACSSISFQRLSLFLKLKHRQVSTLNSSSRSRLSCCVCVFSSQHDINMDISWHWHDFPKNVVFSNLV